nr:hypothetical protein HK105_006106 [Polyrhizophydium stewartii]
MLVRGTDAAATHRQFLALPPLQVDVKATVSPAPLDPPAHASLLVCSNRHGFLVHGTNDGLGFVRTEPLLTAVRNAEPGTRVRPPAGSAASVPLAAGPATHVALAGNELTVFAASAGGALVAFSAASLAASVRCRLSDTRRPRLVLTQQSASPDLQIDASPATPLESTTVPGGDVRALKANPDPNSAQIAVLSSDGAVRFVDFASNAFKVGNPVPIEGITDIDWFPRGKQLACGTSSNKVIQITPAGQIKREYGPPPDIAGDHVQKLRWIEERVFLVIYADTPPQDDDVPQTDAFVLRRGDKDAVEYTKLADPALPFRLERPSHHHIATIEGWGDKAKRIVFVANTTAAEAGVIGCSEDGWRNWSLADNSLISMPLDEEDRDTWPLGLAVDLTSTVTLPPATPDDPPVPPMPILLILNNLGDLLAHHCIMSSVSGPFPSMVEKIQQIPADAKTPAPEPKEPKIELLVSKFDDLYLGLESDFEAFKKYSATVTSTLEDARRPNPNAENLPLKSLALGDLPRVMSAARDTIVRIEHAGKLCSALRSARDELLASMKELAVKNKESKSRLDFLLKRDPDWLAPPGTLGPEAADMRVRLFAKRDRVEEMIDSIKRALELLENNIDQHSSSRRERLKTSDWQSICTTVTQLTKSGLAASHRLDRLIIEMQAAKQAHKSAASTAAGRQHLRRPTAQASGSVSSTHTSPTAFGSSSARKVARTPRGPFGLPDDESFADESVLYPTVPLLADKEAAEKLSQQKAARAKLKQILVRADRVVPINTTATTSQMPKELLRRQLPPRPARPPPVPVSIGAPHATPTLQPPAPARPDAPEALTPIAIASVVVPLAATAPTFGNAPEKTEPASALQFSTSKVAIAPSAPFGSAAKSGEPKPATMFSFTAAGAAAQSDKPSAATAFAFPVPAATAAPLAFGSASKPDDMPAFVFGSAPSDAKPTPLFQVPPSDKPAFLFTATASPSNAVQPAAVESADKDLKSKDKENRSDSGSEGGNYDEYNEDDYEEIHGPEDDEKEYDDFLAENPQMAAASAAAAKAESAPPPPPPPPGEIPGAATANAAPTPQAKQPSATSFTFAAAPQPFSFVAPATKPSTPDAKPGATASPGSGTKTHSPFGASSSIFNQPPAFPLSGDSAPPPAVSPSGLFANMSTPLPKTMPTTFGSGGSPSPLGTGFSFGAKPAGDQLAFASKIPVVGARKADAGGSGGDAEQPIAARLPDFSAIKSPEVSGAGVKLSPAPAPSPQRAAESASPTPAPASPPKMSYSAVAKQPTAAPTAPIVAVATASVHKDDHEQDDYDDADEEGEDAEAQESAADADADQEGEGDVANAEDEEEVVESESEDEEEESQVEDEDDELQVEDPDDEAPAEDADNEAQVEDAEREEAADGDASDQSFEGHNEDDDAPPTDQTPTQGSHVQLVAEREPRPAAIDVHEEASTVGDDESRANYTHSDSSWLHSSTRAREVQQAGAIGGPDDSAPVGVPEELTESEINAGGEPQAPSSFNMGSAFGSFEIVDKSAPGGRPETRMADTDADPQASAVPQGLESLSGIDFGLGSSAPKKSVNPMFAVAAGAAAAPPARPSEGGFGASAFGGSAFGKPSEPGSGPTSFGSFVKKDDAKPAFGQPSFGQPATSTPAFGQSSFGKPAPASTPAAPAFGQSGSEGVAFGKSSFGAAAGAAPAFGSFPNVQGTSSFDSSSFAGGNAPTSFAATASGFGSGGFGAFAQRAEGQPTGFGAVSAGGASVFGGGGAIGGASGSTFGSSSFDKSKTKDS